MDPIQCVVEENLVGDKHTCWGRKSLFSFFFCFLNKNKRGREMNPLVERGNPCETWIFINSCRSNDSFRSERFEELGISNGNISVFLLSKTFVFSFLFWKRKKGWKGAERRKREERKKAYTSQICFFYGCKKLLFWLLSIVYTFLIAGKGQQCLTIFKVKFYNWKRNRVGTAFLFFISFFS